MVSCATGGNLPTERQLRRGDGRTSVRQRTDLVTDFTQVSHKERIIPEHTVAAS
jgi:hypothetical protein